MVEDTESQYLLIICVWQVGAKALLAQYKDLASNIPQGDNIEVLVMDKKDLMEKFLVPEDLQCTTNEINRLCQNIGTRVKDKQVSLFIDECWVTAPVQYSAHLTTVSSGIVTQGAAIILVDDCCYQIEQLPFNGEKNFYFLDDCQ